MGSEVNLVDLILSFLSFQCEFWGLDSQDKACLTNTFTCVCRRVRVQVCECCVCIPTRRCKDVVVCVQVYMYVYLCMWYVCMSASVHICAGV